MGIIATEGSGAQLDTTDGDQNVGQASLRASVTQGYNPGSGTVSPVPTDNSGDTETIEVNGTAQETPAEQTGQEPLPSEENSGSEPEETSASPAASGSEDEPSDGFSVFSLLRRVLTVIAVLAVIGGAITGILYYRARKEEQERTLRKKRREKRLKEWGYSTKEFDQIMEEHLRSKNQFKKRSFRDRFRRR